MFDECRLLLRDGTGAFMETTKTVKPENKDFQCPAAQMCLNWWRANVRGELDRYAEVNLTINFIEISLFVTSWEVANFPNVSPRLSFGGRDWWLWGETIHIILRHRRKVHTSPAINCLQLLESLRYRSGFRNSRRRYVGEKASGRSLYHLKS